jgi:multiple sugar transport system permease protein
MKYNRKKYSINKITKYSLLYIIAAIVVIWSVLPILWMALSSLKVNTNMFTLPPQFIFKPDFDTYEYMFTKADFGKFLLNSLVASISAALISIIIGIFGGYALVRGNFKRKKDLAFWCISTRMAPIPAVVLPLYLMFAKLRLIGTMPGLIFAYTTFNLPFAIWMMMVFFADVPIAIEEASRIDGCSKIQSFFYTALPAVKPGLASTFVLCMMFSWNDYIYASSLTNAQTQTIPVAASLLVTQTGIAWGQAMATGTIIVLPMLILGFIVRKYLAKGFTMGAVK